jgi:hypothetical protein
MTEKDLQAWLKTITAQTEDVGERLEALNAAWARLMRSIGALDEPVDQSPRPAGNRRKYQPLWEWLRGLNVETLQADFREVERVLGASLPPSARRQVAAWYGYEGSALARAIRDAGFRPRNVNLSQTTVEFHRLTEAST